MMRRDPRGGSNRTPAPGRGRGAGPDRRRAAGGFTLVELSIVVAIIGIIVAFVLVASAAGVRRAEERATQGLIAKLDMGVTERLDALMSRSNTANGTHQYLAAVYPVPFNAGATQDYEYWGLPSEVRAQVIARLDAIKAEMPDFFSLNPDFMGSLPNPDGNSYPFLFDATAYPAGATGVDAFLLPLGHMATAYRPGALDAGGNRIWPGPGDNPAPAGDATATHLWRSRATGIYGATWAARGAFNKLLGCAPQGYDGVNNDEAADLAAGVNLIDEWDECIIGLDAAQVAELYARLNSHSPETARAEALYALLIEGLGPSGSIFSRDEFTNRQVQDTDGDGLPEFVDAWDQPLRFYRWPIYYASPVQRGLRPYLFPYETRETSPLDPNNTLVAPAWWSSVYNGVTGPIEVPSTSASLVMTHFLSLMDPPGPPLPDNTWDRSGLTPRRAYYSRPLVISAGPDLTFGLVDPIGLREARRVDFDPTVTDDDFGLDDISSQTLQDASGGAQ